MYAIREELPRQLLAPAEFISESRAAPPLACDMVSLSRSVEGVRSVAGRWD